MESKNVTTVEHVSSKLCRPFGERFLEAKARNRIELANKQGRETVLVHSMGKVGSSTVRYSLRHSCFSDELAIYGTYFLSEPGLLFFNQLEEKGHGSWLSSPRSVKVLLAEGKMLHNSLISDFNKAEKCKIITLVRDPIATNISGFFQNWRWWPTSIQREYKQCKQNDLVQLMDTFISDYPHKVPLTWWDEELSGMFDIDVFSKSFSQRRGYAIYNSEKADVLVLKLENLTDCVETAISEFLGYEGFSLKNANESQQKWYSSLYKKFKQEINLPKQYLDTMYNSKVMTHFYSESEITRFREVWSRN